MDIFKRHPRPWVRSRGDIEDATGDMVGFSVHYGDTEMARAIVAAVNAEPELCARIAALETGLRELRDAHMAEMRKGPLGFFTDDVLARTSVIAAADALLADVKGDPK